MTVVSNIAVIDTLGPEGLPEALAAIPGTPLRSGDAAWALKLGPERAASLQRVAGAFDLGLDSESEATLSALATQRDPGDPPIEVICDSEGDWLSLSDDCASLGTEALKAIPGTRSVSAAGRVEVPIATWTRDSIREIVDTYALRLSPPARRALDGSPAPETQEADRSASPGPATDEPASIRLDASGTLLEVHSGGRAELSLAFAGVPSARSWGTGAGGWLLSANRETARAVGTVLGTHDVDVDDRATRWLEEALRWIARFDVDGGAGAPRIEITTRWGEPTSLEGVSDLTSTSAGHCAPLSPANLRHLARLAAAEPEVTSSLQFDLCADWLERNPDAAEIPPAELDVAAEGLSEYLTVRPLWSDEAMGALARNEAYLLRQRKSRGRQEPHLPASAWPADTIARLIRAHRLHCTAAATAALSDVLATDADRQRLIELSKAGDGEIEIEGLAGELMPFQCAGVAYALERRRLFVADEQGLGKTIQALATVQADGAFPAVVVCPASLKLNWLREAERWLPQREAIALSGRGAQELSDAEIVVLNYEIVDAHVEALDAIGPKALILDESHYVKNRRAKRTGAVIDLADRLGPDALRLALTGTPVVNRPAELAPQLRAIGRLTEFGSARQLERGYGSPASRRLLHERLRGSCYLRRRKAEVLDQLPDKRRAVVAVPIDNRDEYQRAERDFVRWLAEQMQEAQSGELAQTTRAAALVKMTALRRLAARGKLKAAIEWIETFTEAEERLVVFAHHREIQGAVIDRFPESARILGSDKVEAREENVRRFQDAQEGPTLCVCSLEAASHGFTLTAAANVAFLELAWTPAKHDQAEDRLHRIGQSSAVTAWYLLASETIDERIAKLLEDKRQVVDSLTDGGSETSGALVDALIGSYAAGGG